MPSSLPNGESQNMQPEVAPLIDFFTHCYNDGYNNLFRKEKGSNVFDSEGYSYFRKEKANAKHSLIT